MTRHAFTVPGNPVPWQRAQSRNGQRFTAPKTRAYQKQIQEAAQLARVSCLDGPVRMTLRFFRKDAQPCDLDNLAKSVLDALQGGLAVHDDRQVVWLLATKEIDRARPRVEVECEPISASLPPEAKPVPPTRPSLPKAADNALALLLAKPAHERKAAVQRRLRPSKRDYR